MLPSRAAQASSPDYCVNIKRPKRLISIIVFFSFIFFLIGSFIFIIKNIFFLFFSFFFSLFLFIHFFIFFV